MLSPEEVASAFKSHNISVYETDYCFDIDYNVCLKSQNIQDIIKAAEENNVKSVFYSYLLMDKSKFLITDEDMLNFDAYTYDFETPDRYISGFRTHSIFNAYKQIWLN